MYGTFRLSFVVPLCYVNCAGMSTWLLSFKHQPLVHHHAHEGVVLILWCVHGCLVALWGGVMVEGRHIFVAVI